MNVFCREFFRRQEGRNTQQKGFSFQSFLLQVWKVGFGGQNRP
jgi:hypothetical protein